MPLERRHLQRRSALAGHKKQRVLGLQALGDRANGTLIGRVEHGERAGIRAIGGHITQHFRAQAAAAHAEQDDVGQALLADALCKCGEILGVGGAHGGRIEPAQAMGDGIENGGAGGGPHEYGRITAPDTAGNLS
jgi:hypothetical protein